MLVKPSMPTTLGSFGPIFRANREYCSDCGFGATSLKRGSKGSDLFARLCLLTLWLPNCFSQPCEHGCIYNVKTGTQFLHPVECKSLRVLQFNTMQQTYRCQAELVEWSTDRLPVSSTRALPQHLINCSILWGLVLATSPRHQRLLELWN